MTSDQDSLTHVNTAADSSAPAVGKILLFLECHFAAMLSMIFLLALALRVLALFAVKETPYFNFLMMDERIYHDWARQIAEGTYLPRAAYEFSPLPAYIIAMIYRLFSPDPLYTRILNIFLGALTCVIIGLTAKQLDRAATGLLAAVIATLYKPFIFYSVVPLKTALSVFLCAAIIFFLTSFSNRPTSYKCALMGLFIGLALNVRGNYLVFAPVTVFAIFWQYLKHRRPLKRLAPALALFAAGLLVATAPFAIRNHRATGEWVLTTTQAGFNFYLGNNLQNPSPYSQPVAFAASSPILQGVQFTIEASRRVGRPLTAAEASHFWTLEVFRETAQQPWAFFKKCLYKILAPINWFEACDHYDINFLSGFMPFFRLPFLNFVLIWPLGFAGMFMEIAKFRRGGWLAAMFFAYLVSLILFFSNGRYRLPNLTILIPFAAIAINRICSALYRSDLALLGKYLAFISLSTLLQFAPIKGSGDLSAYYNLHGIVMREQGSLLQAIDFWEKSSAMNQSFSPYANLMLAKIRYQQRDYDSARQLLQRIDDHSFAAALKYELLGDIYQSESNFLLAAEAYQKSLDINSGQLNPRRKLYQLLRHTDPDEANRQRSILAQLGTFYRGL